MNWKKIFLVSSLSISFLLVGKFAFDYWRNYNKEVPIYINKDNTEFGYRVNKEGKELGRVLFYDKNLSINNMVSCASCHQQEFAFSDTSHLSLGQNGGLTGRHSMRLINTRYANEVRFFWDERAANLEKQTTMPIQDHLEMGFSATDGNAGIDSMINKLAQIDYYQKLFPLVYDDAQITEERIQQALAQFIRSIQSFDAKYDEGRALVSSNRAKFPNFTDSENRGLALYMRNPARNGAGCNRCHRAPEFAIGPNVANNGIIGVPGDSLSKDLTITRAPTLRDLVNPNGTLNGPLMHDASIKSLRDAIDHYNQVPDNIDLDNRLRNAGGNLGLTETEKVDLENFLRTLTGKAVYNDKQWAAPFSEEGVLTISELLPNSE